LKLEKELRSHKYEKYGMMLVIIAAISLGSEAIAAKIAYRGGASIPTVLAGRFLLAAFLFWASFIFIKPGFYWLSRSEVLSIVFLALGGQGLATALLFVSFQYLSAAIAILLFYVYPLIVSLLAIPFLKEPLTKNKLNALLISFGGLVVVLGLPAGRPDCRGVLAALAASAANALFIIGSKKLLRQIPPRLFTTYTISVVAIAFLLLGLATGSLQPHLGTQSLGAILVLALVCTVIAFSALIFGLNYTEASKASIVLTLEPAITALLGFLILGEKLLPGHLLGGCLILGGIFLAIAKG
jgi:drug/metabolite transporter (DMT)-like permease